MFDLMDSAFSLLSLMLKVCHPLLCLVSLTVKLCSALFSLFRSLFSRHCPIIGFFCLVFSLVLHPLGIICQVLHFFLETGVVRIVVFLIRVSRCDLFLELIMKVSKCLLFVDMMFDFISRVETTTMHPLRVCVPEAGMVKFEMLGIRVSLSSSSTTKFFG